MVSLTLPRTEDRRRDLKLLAFSLLVIAVAMVPLTEMLVRAWDAHGVFWQAVHATADALSLDIDLAVVFPVGVYLGWLALFAADRSKSVQPVLLLLAAGPFLVTLATLGAWFEHVAWVAHLPAFVVGILVGLATGGGHRVLLGDRTQEFPHAATALFAVAAGATLAGLIQVHLLGATAPGRLVVDVLAAAAFLAMFGTFVRYTDRKDVLLVSPSRRAETEVLVGLYDAIESSMGGTLVEGRRGLIQARADLQHGSELREIRSAVRFRYQRPGLFSRWISISADGYSTDGISRRDVATLREEAAGSPGRFGGLVDFFGDVAGSVSPGRSSRRSGLVAELREAAVVLLVVPLSDPDLARLFDADDEGPASVPDFLAVYADLCAAIADDPGAEAVLTVTDAGVARDHYAERFPGTADLDDVEFEHHVLTTLADPVSTEGPDDVEAAFRSAGFVALARASGDDPDEDDGVLDGIDRLLEAIGH